MPVREWFETLSQREKLLVSGAAILLVVAIVMIGAFRPLALSRQRLAGQLTEKQAVLADIERVATRVGRLSGPAAPQAAASGESLVVLIDRTTRSRGLGAYLKRNEPDGATSIRLRFENVPFDDLVAWLAEIQSTSAIGVTSANADPATGVGRVNVNLQLARAAAP